MKPPPEPKSDRELIRAARAQIDAEAIAIDKRRDDNDYELIDLQQRCPHPEVAKSACVDCGAWLNRRQLDRLALLDGGIHTYSVTPIQKGGIDG